MAHIEIDDEVDDSVEVSDDEIVEESSEKYVLHHGESLDWLRSLPDGYADALVTDPPAGIADSKSEARQSATLMHGRQDFV
jgi:hypothetical protein